ncbi:glycoside hydrolase family 15 protein [Teredinibacter haidensis]|uniref:glycoside hydrolase family 15 protein n=1 Tax=Teredinibacter haidensis TaxID=2731755 RepID=UPI000948C9A1|nr:glycoside hydrolase family 15 protein [Teredinibacter haidensis]
MSPNLSKHHLEKLYHEIQTVILSRQSPVTGLLPASTAVNAHGDYTDAWVRDNVYSIIAPWALALAYKRSGEQHKSDELEQATIKLMRGLLQSMMRQSNKVEAFKHSLNPLDSLHAKYDTHSGLTVVADDAWGHLQIDATAIYLLMLAQMTASGLRMIHTYDEVDFVQNLIYYIASAFRTPDYGIWERGNKINNGNTEINASSLGMAKAALQALDGLNLFGTQASKRSVVHTVADALSMARTNLAALLPRESLSKEVDSALLSVIGFPAFAVGDNTLATRTRDEILKKLGGNYGLKRFLWDGHQTTIEDPSRLYYEHSELASFEHVESEWPLFFCYLYINALFSGNHKTARHYREKIEALMVEKDGIHLIPELYYVAAENIELEKENPKSQARLPNDNLPLVWAQSLYYTATLLDEGYLYPGDLDPLGLRGKTTQFARAQVALVVLAENEHVKHQLASNGVIAESIDDISPIRAISAPHLVEAYGQVGANQKLNLSGRPKRRLLSLATSQTYNLNDQQCLCLSWIQGDQSDDYSLRDAGLVAKMMKKEISHILEHWLNSEVAVFTFMVSEQLCRAPDSHLLFDCIKNYQLRMADENIGYASANLAYLASRENHLQIPNLCITPLASTARPGPEHIDWNNAATALLHKLKGDESEQVAQLLNFFDEKEFASPASDSNTKLTLLDLLHHIYQQAMEQHHWLVTRATFALSHRRKSDLADYLSVLSARHFSVIVGENKNCEFGLHPALNNHEIVEVLCDASNHPVEHSLLQEILELIGVFQRTKPQFFDGLRSIHLHNLLRLCDKQRAEHNHIQTVLTVGTYSPHELLEKLNDIFQSMHLKFSADLKKNLAIASGDEEMGAMDMDWFEWRFERGMIMSLNRDFLENIWKCLSLAPQLIFGDTYNPNCVIQSSLIQSSMTPGEEIFAQLIDNALAQLHPPYFKSALVEGLVALTTFHEQYPTAQFNGPINLETILEMAAIDFCEQEHHANPTTRKIDILLEESPQKLAHYFHKVFKSRAQHL